MRFSNLLIIFLSACGLVLSSRAVSATEDALDGSFLCNIATFQFTASASAGGSDCWGWAGPDGTEYAIMGSIDGIVFVNASELQPVDTVKAQGSLPLCSFWWRDIKTYGHYCYAVTDCAGGVNEGMLVIDMSFLPDSVHLIRTVPLDGQTLTTSHNISIDTLKGFLYAEGEFGPGKSPIYILDLENPEDPVFVGGFGDVLIHDLFAHNDTVFTADAGSSSFSIWNTANKQNPVRIERVHFARGTFAHNVWPTADRKHVVTTQELPEEQTIKVWDISTLKNIHLVGEYLGPSLRPHNALIRGDTMYVSHYESGVRIVDLADPVLPFEIAAFDTYPTNLPDFNGCWGVYPFTPSGTIYASNIDGRLFILKLLSLPHGDALYADTARITEGLSGFVTVSAHNSLPVSALTIPYTYDGALEFEFDSITVRGTRASDFEIVELDSFDPFARKGVIVLKGSDTEFTKVIPVGEEPVCRLWFTAPFAAEGAGVSLNLNPALNRSATFQTQCGFEITPIVSAGRLEVGCCSAAGDYTGEGVVNIADVTAGVAYLFNGGGGAVCAPEGDFTGDGKYNIADITAALAFLFNAGPAPICGSMG